MEQFLKDRIPKGWEKRLFPTIKNPKMPKTLEQKKELYKNNVKCRRNRLIKIKSLLGSQCSVCGYKKNWGALELHHTHREHKSFVVNTSTVMNYKWNLIEAEFKKCTLVCANCHVELHNPQLTIPQDVGLKDSRRDTLVAVKLT